MTKRSPPPTNSTLAKGTDVYLDTQALPRVDRVANETIRAQAQQLVALTEEIERLLAVIEEMKEDK